jgi:hemerythrin-like domain-containing protein
MSSTASSLSQAAAAQDTATPRHDLYGGIHKALRLLMVDTLARLGRMDPADAIETSATFEQIDALLATCRSHLAKENQYVHAALEARQPGASRATADEHAAHQDALALLQAELEALRAQPTGSAAERLYRHLARFVAENLEHMHAEEAHLNPLLWSLYTDVELREVEDRLVASLSPGEVATVLRWMLPALRPAERHGMLAAMRAQLPSEAFAGVLAIARHALDPAGWTKLARALDLEVHGAAAAAGVAA